MAIAWSGWMRRLAGWVWNPETGEQRPGPPLGHVTASGNIVTDTRAMQVPTVMRCIRIIGETCASLPLQVFERTPAGDIPAPNHWLSRLLVEPNDGMTGDELREALVGQMAGWGNGYAEIVRDTTGRPRELWPLKADLMVVKRDENRVLRYEYPDRFQVPQGYSAGQILHCRAFSVDGVMGMSPLGFLRHTLGLTVGAEDLAASFFNNGGRPSAILSVDKPLTPSQREQVREQITRPLEEGRRIMVLEGSMKYQTVTISPEDMQMLATRQFQVEEIARCFGVPLHLLGVQNNVPNWGLEQMNQAFFTFVLNAYLGRIESTINRFLLAPEERQRFFVRHDVKPLLRADSGSRASYLSSLVQNGLMTRNEARRWEGMPPVEGGDELTVQLNLTNLTQLNASRNAIGNPVTNNGG